MEHENVPDNRQFGIVSQVRIVQDIPLVRCKVEGIAVGRFLAAIEGIDLVVGILHPLAPVQEGAEEVHDVDDGRIGKRLWLVVDKHTGSVEVGMLLTK